VLSDAELCEPFARWLAARWPLARELVVEPFESPRSGYSARTLFVPVRYLHDGRERREKLVFRLENPEPAIYPAQAPGLDVEIEIQYRVMQALTRTSRVPLAPLVGYEPDASLVGAPFFAMRHVEGDVTIENPPYPAAGFFHAAAPAERSAMLREGLRILAELHRVDWRAAGLGWLVPPGTQPGLEAQLDLWEGFARRELGERTLPIFERGVSWLRRHLPSGLESRFGWGDARLGNIIFRGARAVCVTDFEAACIAPPEVDLGRAEQRACYAEAAGLEPQDTYPYEVFAAVRYCAIVVRVMNRMVARGLLPADQIIWRENPAVAALAQLLDDPPQKPPPSRR
jgi:aminoglycoside phosphotransferase (APT) family kinase protein